MPYECHDHDWDSKAGHAVHESILAGLSEEERAAAVAEGMRMRVQRFDDYGFHSQATPFWDEEVDYFSGEAFVYYDKLLKPISGEVPQSLGALLAMMDKQSLTELASFLDISAGHPTGADKGKLAAMLAREISGLPAELLSDRVSWFTSAYVRRLRSILEDGGHALVRKGSANIAQEFISPRAPFLFGFDLGEVVELVVPVDMRGPLSRINWGDIVSQRMNAEAIEHYVVLHAQLRGIDTLDNVYARWVEWKGGLSPEEARAAGVRETGFEEFCRIAMRAELTAGENYETVRTRDGLWYLVHGSMFWKVQPGNCRWNDVKGEDAKRLERELAKFSGHEREAHVTPEMARFSSLTAWAQSLPEAIALRRFLDRRVPEGSDELLFADHAVRSVVEMARTLDEARFLYCQLDSLAVVQGEDEVNEAARLLAELANATPKWEYAGRTPREEFDSGQVSAIITAEELLRNAEDEGVFDELGGFAEVGRPDAFDEIFRLAREHADEADLPLPAAFYDENGKLRKIGRNEPCPCGSGKKYKKCHGR